MSPKKRPPLNLPPRKRNAFTERDLARAIRAARKTGGVVGVEIDRNTGNIRVVLGEQPKDNGTATNPWDEVPTSAAD
jgi:hypothetical protein